VIMMVLVMVMGVGIDGGGEKLGYTCSAVWQQCDSSVTTVRQQCDYSLTTVQQQYRHDRGQGTGPPGAGTCSVTHC
jgi:hypothetical protein